MKTIRAFLWGGAIGALIGLLFAPQRGDQTRALLQQRWSQIQGQAQTRLSGVIEQGRQQVTSGLQQVQSLANRAASTVQSNLQ
jgi:gas vesicle protein